MPSLLLLIAKLTSDTVCIHNILYFTFCYIAHEFVNNLEFSFLRYGSYLTIFTLGHERRVFKKACTDCVEHEECSKSRYPVALCETQIISFVFLFGYL